MALTCFCFTEGSIARRVYKLSLVDAMIRQTLNG
jgi:hypothetical protein